MGAAAFVNERVAGGTVAPKRRIDLPLVVTVIAILVFGLTMVYSASWDYSLQAYGDPMYMFARKLQWLGLGVAAAAVLTLLNYHHWRRLIVPIMGITINTVFDFYDARIRGGSAEAATTTGSATLTGPYELNSTTNGVASSSATLSFDPSIAATTAATTASTTGTLTSPTYLIDTAEAATTSGSATLSTALDTNSTVAATSDGTGTLSFDPVVDSTTTGTTTATGTLSYPTHLSDTSEAATTAGSGTLSYPTDFNSTAASSSQGTGTLSFDPVIASTTAATTPATATLTYPTHLIDTAEAASVTSSGTLTYPTDINSTTASTSQGTGTLSFDPSIASTTAGTTSATATLAYPTHIIDTAEAASVTSSATLSYPTDINSTTAGTAQGTGTLSFDPSIASTTAATTPTTATKDEFHKDIKRSKEILESITSTPVLGYRAPSFSITPKSEWAIDVLKGLGFTYDSSIFPTSFHNRYGFNGISPLPFQFNNGLSEIPLSTYRFGGANFPLAGGGYFRLFPYVYFRHFFRRLNRQGKPIVFYLHPWELDPGQPKMKVRFNYRLRHYINLEKTEKRLEKLLKEFRFSPLIKLVDNYFAHSKPLTTDRCPMTNNQ